MIKLKQQYDKNNEFETYIKTYIQTEKGKFIVDNYKKTCDVSPKNIYTDDVDLEARYISESFILYLCTNYFRLQGFNIDELMNEIKEIDIYYPWLRNYNAEIREIDITSPFEKLLGEWLNEFFTFINQRVYGEYYTPLELVNLALKQVNVNIFDRVVDPSCGSGFFLYAYLGKLQGQGQLNSAQQITIVQENLYGYDIFPFAVITTKLLLGSRLFELFQIRDNIFRFNNIKIKNTLDYLSCNNKDLDEPKFQFIFGNPPFFRIDPKVKSKICSCISYGHNYAHSLFLHWSIQNLENKGTLCLFLPESMLSGFYYQKSRRELLEKCSLDLIITNKDHEKEFSVQQEVMILIAHKQPNTNKFYKVATSINRYTNVEEYQLPIGITENSFYVIPIIKNQLEYEVLFNLSRNEEIELFNHVELGTGNFVWNQNKELCFVNRVDNSIPLISGPCITNDGINLTPQRKSVISYCIPDKDKYIKREKVILFRRMSPIDNDIRMVAAIVDPDILGSYVVENHVNIIKSEDSTKLEGIYKFITSTDFNILINAFCHTNQISTNDIKSIIEVLAKVRQ